MNLHLSAHFPVIQIVVAVVGAVLYGASSKDPWKEYGKVLLWSGMFCGALRCRGKLLERHRHVNDLVG